ncbi:hypothetical protein LOD99_708 [Oopsacas minuta]|uniref:Uncharacterized protein n=1 Tax=Oopsacas minuta TaxID=111878 RepID=A0AAV7K133_9METZ|nr:hypothetical protein LOD99_708 [Oopsacas minuta]
MSQNENQCEYHPKKEIPLNFDDLLRIHCILKPPVDPYYFKMRENPLQTLRDKLKKKNELARFDTGPIFAKKSPKTVSPSVDNISSMPITQDFPSQIHEETSILKYGNQSNSNSTSLQNSQFNTNSPPIVEVASFSVTQAQQVSQNGVINTISPKTGSPSIDKVSPLPVTKKTPSTACQRLINITKFLSEYESNSTISEKPPKIVSPSVKKGSPFLQHQFISPQREKKHIPMENFDDLLRHFCILKPPLDPYYFKTRENPLQTLRDKLKKKNELARFDTGPIFAKKSPKTVSPSVDNISSMPITQDFPSQIHEETSILKYGSQSNSNSTSLQNSQFNTNSPPIVEVASFSVTQESTQTSQVSSSLSSSSDASSYTSSDTSSSEDESLAPPRREGKYTLRDKSYITSENIFCISSRWDGYNLSFQKSDEFKPKRAKNVDTRKEPIRKATSVKISPDNYTIDVIESCNESDNTSDDFQTPQKSRNKSKSTNSGYTPWTIYEKERLVLAYQKFGHNWKTSQKQDIWNAHRSLSGIKKKLLKMKSSGEFNRILLELRKKDSECNLSDSNNKERPIPTSLSNYERNRAPLRPSIKKDYSPSLATYRWTEEETNNLIEGQRLYGNNWLIILRKYQFHPSRSSSSLKYKFSTKEMRAKFNEVLVSNEISEAQIEIHSSPPITSPISDFAGKTVNKIVSTTNDRITTSKEMKNKTDQLTNKDSSTYVKWTDWEVENLMKGIREYGTRWSIVFNNCKFHPSRTPSKIKTKYYKIKALDAKNKSFYNNEKDPYFLQK